MGCASSAARSARAAPKDKPLVKNDVNADTKPYNIVCTTADGSVVPAAKPGSFHGVVGEEGNKSNAPTPELALCSSTNTHAPHENGAQNGRRDSSSSQTGQRQLSKPPVPSQQRRGSLLNGEAGSVEQKESAAIAIQRRARGITARGATAQRKESKAVEHEFFSSLDPLLSPADNATKSLLGIASRVPLSPMDAAAVKYAVRVLQLDPQISQAPLLLAQEDDSNDSVVRWIRAEFTKLDEARRETPLKLKTVAIGVLTPLRLRQNSRQRSQQFGLFLPEDFAVEPPIDESDYTKLRMVLSRSNEWEWDIFELVSLADGHQLKLTFWYVINFWGLIQEFRIPKATLFRWLEYVESSYYDNPYHNATHAADVLQTVHAILLLGGGGETVKFFSQLEILALFIAAIVHDMEHDGKNNVFHKQTSSERAVAHNDRSIQENHHVMAMYSKLAEDPSINFIQHLGDQQQTELRRLIILAVLGTDMSKHFEDMKELKDAIESKGTAPGKWLGAGSDLLMKTLLHLSDISNPAKPIPVASQWATRVLEEFFLQGDLEKKMGLPVSPQCDRETTSLAKSQAGFIKFVVLPAYKILGTLLPSVAAKLVPMLESNLAYWEALDALRPTPSASAQALPPLPAPAPKKEDVKEV